MLEPRDNLDLFNCFDSKFNDNTAFIQTWKPSGDKRRYSEVEILSTVLIYGHVALLLIIKHYRNYFVARCYKCVFKTISSVKIFNDDFLMSTILLVGKIKT